MIPNPCEALPTVEQEPIPTPPIASVRFEDLDKNQDGIISTALRLTQFVRGTACRFMRAALCCVSLKGRDEFEQFQQEMIAQAFHTLRGLCSVCKSA